MRGLFARNLAIGLCVPLGLAIVGATPAFAQLSDGSSGPTSIGGASQRMMRGTKQNAGKPVVAPPPVLPGTKTSPEAAAPTGSAADMTPTDALFDAINRGDLPSARDAVNRGAELNGRNLLGMTPLEQAVDLGRNDISFMLLSMRDADSASRALTRRGTSGDANDGDAILRGGAAPRSAGRARVTPVSTRTPEEPVAESPRLYSGNGGVPIPAAGFLGFDAGRGVR
jgi:hypothetical protein